VPETLEVLVDGGKATAGPPLGPALGPMGMNIMEVVKAINDRTKSFEGMKVPVKLIIDPKTKAYSIEIGTPPTSALILKELGAEKGSGEAGKTRIGNLSVAQVVKIANMKADAMLGKDQKARVLEVVGTCVSMGVTVDGKGPKEITPEIRAGKYDKVLGKA
jgi:large subunit ribosomal protein L11